LTIQELAQLHGITPAAIRHYERLGLFDAQHVTRLTNGYRDFTQAASERLRLIRLGQAAGFSLRDMATRLKHWDDGGFSAAEKKDILAKQLEQIDEKIRQLEGIKQHILQEIEKECQA
jgi:DNA-binding transcriptional MerR regulator